MAVATDTTPNVLAFPLEVYQAPAWGFHDARYPTHQGLDFSYASMLTSDVPVYAPISGKIIASKNDVPGPTCIKENGNLAGNFITIQDETETYTVTLMHLKTGSVQTYDDTIHAGDIVGYVGNTGNTRTTERTGENFYSDYDGIDGDGDGLDADVTNEDGIGQDGAKDNVSGDQHGVCGNIPNPQRAHHLHVQLTVSGVLVDPTNYWIRNDNDIPFKAEGTVDEIENLLPGENDSFFIKNTTQMEFITANTPNPDDVTPGWDEVLEATAVISGNELEVVVKKAPGAETPNFSIDGIASLMVDGYDDEAMSIASNTVDVGDASSSFTVLDLNDETLFNWNDTVNVVYVRYETKTDNVLDGRFTVVGPISVYRYVAEDGAISFSLGGSQYTTDNTPDPTLEGGSVGALTLEAENNGSNVTFSVTKTNGVSFGNKGKLYLKVGMYDSSSANRGEPIDVQDEQDGAIPIVFPVDDQAGHEWPDNDKNYYARFEVVNEQDQSTGDYTVVGPITVYRVPSLGKVANTDGDYDGLEDSVETMVRDAAATGTDPDNPDTDGDGLSDGFEVAEELNPLLVDSNGDGIEDSAMFSDGEDEANVEDGDGGPFDDCGVVDDMYLDTDNDGLEDYLEMATHTSCILSDSDGDNLSDGYEIDISYTDPNNPDSDEDGLTDGTEWNSGTNALDPDTDDDTLPDGSDPNPTLSDYDVDNDVYSVAEGDCNDAEPTIHPSAFEICEDGIDQNCSGADISCTPGILPNMSIWGFDHLVNDWDAVGDIPTDPWDGRPQVGTSETFTREGDGSNTMQVDIDSSLNKGDPLVIFNQLGYDGHDNILDLSQYASNGYFTMWVWIPYTENLLDIDFNWGDDDIDYWRSSADRDINGNPFQYGWNQVAFAWTDDNIYRLIKIGDPQADKINYLSMGVEYRVPYPNVDTTTATFYFDDLRIDDEIHPDYDVDGYEDAIDAFPSDPAEWNDRDGDGHGDNGDRYPDDSTEWADTDGDGHGDNNDMFPNNSGEWVDADADGIGENSDRCAETQEGATVNTIGCAFEQTATLLTIESTDSIARWSFSQDAILTAQSAEAKNDSYSLAFNVNTQFRGNNYTQLWTSTEPLDLSSYEQSSTFLQWVYLPTAEGFSFFEFYWGNTTTGNFNISYANANAEGQPFTAGWNLVPFFWDATNAHIGEVDASIIDTYTVFAAYDEAVFPQYSTFLMDDIMITHDVDGDTVANTTDVCPFTAPIDGNDIVNESGCALSQLDSDTDGLTDYDESVVHGTDPADSDSDNDGLNDGREVNTTFTNPLDTDSDNDNLNDVKEVDITHTDPLDSDSDNDTLSDSQEVNRWHTDPNDADTDDDRLNDRREVKVYHTNPLDTDTDDDGFSDYREIQLGRDPLVAGA